MAESVIWEDPVRVSAGRRAVPNAPDMETLSDAPRDLMSVSDLAEEFPGLGERWVRRVADERRVSVYRVGGRVLISRQEFGEFLASGRQPARF